MLHLHQTYAANPSAGLHHLVLSRETVLLYPSADAVIILNARTLTLVRVLAFWEVFPLHAKNKITCISVDHGMKLVVAAMETRLAVWALSPGVQQDTWRIHSSLILPEHAAVTTLDSKSGLLAVGSERYLSVYTLILENDLPTWSLKWMVPIVAPPCFSLFSPSLMYIVASSRIDNSVRIYSTTTGRQTQIIPHPRPVINITWRHSQTSNRDDLILYTVTADAILRIFFPVLDAPQHLQLHTSLDLVPSASVPICRTTPNAAKTSAFWLDREVIGVVINNILKSQSLQDDARSRRLREIKEEGWDLFLRVLSDGSILVTAVANIDSRPPTLLEQFTLQQSRPSLLHVPPSFLYLLPSPDQMSLTLITSSPLTSFNLFPLLFFDGQSDGLLLSSNLMERVPEEEFNIKRFVRTPEGNGVGVIRANSGGEAWRVVNYGSKLTRSGSWDAADHVVVLDGGRSIATYLETDCTLMLHGSNSTSIKLPAVNSLFSMPSKSGHDIIFGITLDFSVVQVRIGDGPTLTLYTHSSLPLVCSPKMILPVDPMAWVRGPSWVEHDVLLSVSKAGELAFWVPDDLSSGWRCTGRVRTERTGITRARCSSSKKSALIVPELGNEELTIWDSHESEFASGLEYRGFFSDPINDLDWTSTPDNQSILAVGFLHHIELLCQQRMTYFDEGPGWAMCWKVEIGNFIPNSISDSIWLANGSLLLAAGHQMCLFGQSVPSITEPPQSGILFDYVARQNGPLVDYHPQMLLQCLLWDKVELVKEIIINLARDVKTRTKDSLDVDYNFLPVERFLRKDLTTGSRFIQKKHYNLLFNASDQTNESDELTFSRPLITHLIDDLETQPLPHLTPNEHAHLLVLIQTALEIDEQRRSLDSNGLRYLISMRSFYILNHRASAPSSPQTNGGIPRQTGRRERLRYRDMIWAFHSESQDLLLDAAASSCNGKMRWPDARKLGIAIWLNSIDSMKSQMEIIARNEYMAGENRDPTLCSLYYFALGKVKLVHGLWRQAAWHKEQTIMLKFLANNFTETRWRTAALKNAYALLSKQRFEYAAAFFLLGNALKDAVNICIKQLGDFQLGVALARVAEQSNEGPVLRNVLTTTVLPIAFKDGNRWLGSWAFWLLHRRDLSVRILLTPLQDIANALDISVKEIGEPHYDDPSLALLFSQLRSKTLQAAKGTSEISGRAEFNFVLQMARVFCRMGCHVLALDLVRSWSFERPSTVVHERSVSTGGSDNNATPDPALSLRSRFAFEPAMRRMSSIMIDMDIPSIMPTRATSPVGATGAKSSPVEEQITNEKLKRMAGLGSLMKSAKQDVKVPEFDMSAFM